MAKVFKTEKSYNRISAKRNFKAKLGDIFIFDKNEYRVTGCFNRKNNPYTATPVNPIDSFMRRNREYIFPLYSVEKNLKALN